MRARAMLGALALLALTACKSDVYSNLSEFEVNQMLAVMMAHGIAAEKRGVGESFTLRVAESDMLRAIALLNDRGFPRNSRDSIGTVFQKSGIISSPFEERVRYIYALGEDVAQTISQIDGVMSARVHIVLPEEPQLGQPVRPSSAAVFIRHEPNVDLEFFVPQIRRLVSSAIQGLDNAAVTVVLTEATPTELTPLLAAEVQTVEVLPGLNIRQEDVGTFWTVAAAGSAALVLLVTGVGFLMSYIRRRRSGQGRKTQSGEGAVALMEPS